MSKTPLQAVLPLNAYDLDDLKRSAERSDQTWLYANCGLAKDKNAVLGTIAKAFPLPKYTGTDLDKLYDCLTGLKTSADTDVPGIVVVLESLPDSPMFSSEQRDDLLDVFREASDFFSERNVAFRIFYSVNKISKH